MNTIFKIIFLVISISLFSSCAAQKGNTQKIPEKIILKALTRGNFENISIINNKYTYKSPSSSKSYILNTKNKQDLNAIISKINLETITTLKAPSEKRLYDGAMNTHILIKLDQKEYTSANFDHDNPPKTLKDLVDLLRNLAQQ